MIAPTARFTCLEYTIALYVLIGTSLWRAAQMVATGGEQHADQGCDERRYVNTTAKDDYGEECPS